VIGSRPFTFNVQHTRPTFAFNLIVTSPDATGEPASTSFFPRSWVMHPPEPQPCGAQARLGNARERPETAINAARRRVGPVILDTILVSWVFDPPPIPHHLSRKSFFTERRRPFKPSHTLEQRRPALPAADAHRDDTVARLASLHLVGDGTDQTRTGHAE